MRSWSWTPNYSRTTWSCCLTGGTLKSWYFERRHTFDSYVRGQPRLVLAAAVAPERRRARGPASSTCPPPVDGLAIGGGHVLHVPCDLTIASSTARFGQSGPKVGSY